MIHAIGLEVVPPSRLADFRRRFESKLQRDPATGCVNWIGGNRRRRYGEIQIEYDGRRRRLAVHRVAYEFAHGPIDPTLTIDHTCRNTWCCNHAHLEVVTRAVNTARQMAAIHGSDPGSVCGSGHVGEYRRDPRTNKLYCRGCHRDRWRRLHGRGIAYRGRRVAE